jgi:hypothetical protein
MGNNHRPRYSGVGGLQQALNDAVRSVEDREPMREVWQTLRDTCGYTNDELVTHASLLGAVIIRPEERTGFWGIEGSAIQTYNVGVLCWRWLMDNHKFVLEDEYNARRHPANVSARENDIEVDRGTSAT